MGNRLRALLLLLGIVLIAVVIAEVRLMSYGVALTKPVPDPTRLAAPAEVMFSLPPLEAFSEFVERPLFLANRRLRDPEVESTAQPESTPPADTASLTLNAVVIDGDDRFVLIRDRSTGGLLSVHVGESVLGWVVTEIQGDSVVLNKQDQTEVLRLRNFEPVQPKAEEAKSTDSGAAEVQEEVGLRRTGRRKSQTKRPAGG